MMKDIKKLTAKELNDKIKQNSDLIVINVLTRNTYEDCRIKNSMNISFEELQKHVEKWNKNKEIVLYCSDFDCNLDKNVFEFLDKKGFKNLFGYEGGMTEWRKNDYPVIKE